MNQSQRRNQPTIQPASQSINRDPPALLVPLDGPQEPGSVGKPPRGGEESVEQDFAGRKLQLMPAFLAAFCLLGCFSGFVWCVAALLLCMLEKAATCDRSTLNPCHRGCFFLVWVESYLRLDTPILWIFCLNFFVLGFFVLGVFSTVLGTSYLHTSTVLSTSYLHAYSRTPCNPQLIIEFLHM